MGTDRTKTGLGRSKPGFAYGVSCNMRAAKGEMAFERTDEWKIPFALCAGRGI